ncbi:MAG: pimeloyl-CoA dehydrogenase large subunit [Paracoccus denitrificans]|nr:MAG: pimeloyl-CoA dehydrogenase large subunit [Paracoccus denitrificans]PZO84274.1 MAG: pimeloyl-CoA dehydrogenase large subunit [Paracoccus denitrificans]
MDMTFTDDENAFRAEVRAFIDTELDDELRDKVRLGKELTKADLEGWHAKLNAKGWLAGVWPKEFGGGGWNAVTRHIFEEESARAHAPRVLPFGIMMLGPVLQKFGSPEQQQRWLPRILSGDDWWCQGYSEPGAGSDLASLKTRAVRDGDDYVVNGQKTWTTLGQHANMIFCLVRTSTEGKPQQGISFLLIDMQTPGVTVRPIRLIDGSVEVNEVFFDDVRVPAENLVGEENQGWTYAKYLLTHERTNISGVGFAWATLDALRRSAKGDPDLALAVADAEIDLLAMETTNLRLIAAATSGQTNGVESSMLKVKGSQLRQRLNDLARRAWGEWALIYPSEEMGNITTDAPPEALAANRAALNQRKLTIYGGSTEIQRGIIAKQLLGV